MRLLCVYYVHDTHDCVWFFFSFKLRMSSWIGWGADQSKISSIDCSAKSMCDRHQNRSNARLLVTIERWMWHSIDSNVMWCRKCCEHSGKCTRTFGEELIEGVAQFCWIYNRFIYYCECACERIEEGADLLLSHVHKLLVAYNLLIVGIEYLEHKIPISAVLNHEYLWHYRIVRDFGRWQRHWRWM